MSLKDELKSHLEQFHTAPFLFIGSGFSRRYLGLEDWEGLLRRFAALTSRPYEYFRSSANGLYPAIAAEIARDLHSIWWQSPAFEESRSKYGSDARNRESALKIEISRYLESVSDRRATDPDLVKELETLPRATIDGIVTTNWDLLLEQIFPDLETYVGQDELLFSPSHGIGEIYKIHGCCSKPNSLVATTDDYDRFNQRNPYLAAKLLTVFAEHPVIFLGYSLNDPDISSILQSIAMCLTTDNIGQLRDRLILIRWEPKQEGFRWEDNTLVTNGFVIPVKTVVTNSFAPVFDSISELPRKFPARLLRRLKEHVYELVHDNDPADRLYVVDIDDDTDTSKIKVVYGVGVRVEDGEVHVSSEPGGHAARLTDDPNAPVLPFRPPLADAAYPNRQAELDALVRGWRSDRLAYIARSRMRAFYAERATLALSADSLKCLLVSAMHHGGPIHYWASRMKRYTLVSMLEEEVRLDLHPRVRYTARLAFAVGMSDGDRLLEEIARRSKHVAVRNLADRLRAQKMHASTIHAEYRSPARSTHTIGGREITIDVATAFEAKDDVECVLSFLSNQTDTKSQTRVRQLDAYFYGTRL
jgi:hypothetical protein